MLIVSILVGMCQAGGIGGGPIISPVMIALLGIGQRRAVWDTYVLLFGGSIGSYIKLYKERLSETGSSLINYRLILITLPLLLSGAVLGVMMGKFLPKIIVGILLFLILLQVIIKTNRSYKRVRQLEIQRNRLDSNNDNKNNWIELKFITDEYTNWDNNQTVYSYSQQYITKPTEVNYKEEIIADQLKLTSLTTALIFKSPQLLSIQEDEKNLFPVPIIIQIILQVLIVIVIQIIKGSQFLPSIIGIEFCSINYHFMTFIQFLIGLVSVKIYKNRFENEEKEKEALGYDFNRDGKLTHFIDKTVKASLYAGFLGGLVGLGGGTVLTPLWLEMGMASPRAAASASFCVFFTALISVSVQIMVGAYTLSEILILLIASGCGSYIVSGYLKVLVIKYKRESLVIQVLLIVILFGLIILPINTLKNIMDDPYDSIQFGQLC